MRPGTVDYSRWDHLKSSSDDEDDAPPPPPPHAPPAAVPASKAAGEARTDTPLATPPEPSHAAARAPDAAAERDDDAGAASLRVLLSHPGALQLLGGGASNAKACDPFLDAKLPAELAAALHAVTRANDATRGAARLATVDRAMRDAAGRVRDAERWDLCLRRERVFRSIVAALKDADEDDERERQAGERQYDPNVYYDSDEEEARGNALAYLLMGTAGPATHVLNEMASWTVMPPDLRGVTAQQPAVTKLARQLAMRELDGARKMMAASLDLQLARSNDHRAWHNDYLDRTGSEGPRAPAAPTIAQTVAAAPPLSADVGEGVLMLKSTAMLDLLEALSDQLMTQASRLALNENA